MSILSVRLVDLLSEKRPQLENMTRTHLQVTFQRAAVDLLGTPNGLCCLATLQILNNRLGSEIWLVTPLLSSFFLCTGLLFFRQI